MLSKFKAQLKADADAKIEELKSSLQMAALEHQVRFSNLHEKRAQLIADLYERLVDVFWVGQHFVITGAFTDRADGGPTQYNNAVQKILDFTHFFDIHRIYLPSGICTLLTEFIDKVRRQVIRVGVYGPIDPLSDQSYKERNEAIMAAYVAFDQDIPATRIALEEEFRAILGAAQGSPPSVVRGAEAHSS